MAESVELKSMGPKHMAIADALLANPEQKRGDLAGQMHVSESWLSIVIHSSVFQEYFAARRDKHEEELRSKIVGKQLEVALLALNKLQDVLNDDKVDGRLVLDVAEKTAERLGFTPRPTARGRVIEERSQVFTRPASPGVFDGARETITRKIVHEQEIPVGSPA